MSDQRFQYNGRIYATTTLDELSLNDLIVFEEETAAAGNPLTLVDAEKIPPNSALAIAIGVWATMRAAGDEISFADARKIRMKDLKAVPTPADHRKASPKAKKSSRSTATATDAKTGEASTQQPTDSVES